MTKDEQIRRGEAAKRLLEDPILIESLETLERTYLESWRRTESKDVEGRERLWIALQVAEEFVRNLRAVADSGELAHAQVERIKGKKV